jgi:hypothetical protein
MNPTPVTNPFIFSAYSGPRQIGNVSEEKMQQSLYKIRNCVTVWSRIAVCHGSETASDMMTADEYENLAPEEKEHFAICVKCGEMFDRRSLDEVL